MMGRKIAAAKGIIHNKFSSACAADLYHGTHAQVDVRGKVRGKEVTHMHTMSPALLMFLLRAQSQLILFLRSQK